MSLLASSAGLPKALSGSGRGGTLQAGNQCWAYRAAHFRQSKLATAIRAPAIHVAEAGHCQGMAAASSHRNHAHAGEGGHSDRVEPVQSITEAQLPLGPLQQGTSGALLLLPPHAVAWTRSACSKILMYPCLCVHP